LPLPKLKLVVLREAAGMFLVPVHGFAPLRNPISFGISFGGMVQLAA
jgi:hypothetical protein